MPDLSPQDALPQEKHPFYSKIVSFAPRSTRLKDRQAKVWDELAPTYVVTPQRAIARASIDPSQTFDAAQVFGRDTKFIIEIGSGQGECAEHAATAAPDTNFLAIEVYLPGIASTLVKIRRSKLENLRVLQADAAEAFDTYFQAESADEVWMFFPDPWHKTKHNKRRLVQPNFVTEVAQTLKPSGVWRLATDWLDYAEHMIAVIDESPYFARVMDQGRFEGRVLTSFEKKGLAKDRIITDLTYVRTDVAISSN